MMECPGRAGRQAERRRRRPIFVVAIFVIAIFVVAIVVVLIFVVARSEATWRSRGTTWIDELDPLLE
jgi:ABC-type Fe3+ transport system permease subunit